jgi:hypothetical protein
MAKGRNPRDIHLRIHSLRRENSGFEGTLCCIHPLNCQEPSGTELPMTFWLDYHMESHPDSVVDMIGCKGQPKILSALTVLKKIPSLSDQRSRSGRRV